MQLSIRSGVPRCAAVLIWISAFTAFAAATSPAYVMTNDDTPFENSVTFYTIGANDVLSLTQQVQTSGGGIAGGYFSTYRLAVLDNGTEQCVYASDASSGNIVGIDIDSLTVGGNASGSTNDSGNANGIGLALNNQYLYAGFTTSNTIGTFQIQPGCSLTFVNDVSVSGLQGGFINAMALHGNIMVVTYGDGSIESFNISSGTPVSNGDEQNSTAYFRSQGVSYPNSAEITKDGHYVLFGDTSTSSVVEVSDLRSGKLRKTVVYASGQAINSSNILLSPDETLLYISNTEGATISAASFDKTTGKIIPLCISPKLKGYGSSWSYLAEMVTATNTGTGGLIYVAEFGASSSIGMVEVESGGGRCGLIEVSGSPVADPNSTGLLSIGSFPPRSF